MSDKNDKQSPPRPSFRLEFWVGLFAIAGVICFAYLAINIASMRFTSAGFYKVYARFSNVAGLQVGAPVEVAGVRIGEVTKVTLESAEAILTLEVRDGIPLRDDDIAQIRTKGIIGDKYVRISPGASDDTLAAGDSISDTESAVEFEEIIGKIVHSLESGSEDK